MGDLARDMDGTVEGRDWIVIVDLVILVRSLSAILKSKEESRRIDCSNFFPSFPRSGFHHLWCFHHSREHAVSGTRYQKSLDDPNEISSGFGLE
jgi:hypothetical protein